MVIIDCTHSNQKPNQSEGVTGGDPDRISTIAFSAIAAGADGMFIETHHKPKRVKVRQLHYIKFRLSGKHSR